MSSYPPTVRALLAASRDRPAAESAESLLVVAMAETPNQPDLPNVTTEVNELTRLDGITPVVLDDGNATVDAVRAALSTHRWVHFACHGEVDLSDPSRSGLMLADGMAHRR